MINVVKIVFHSEFKDSRICRIVYQLLDASKLAQVASESRRLI